jgi:hypothetical protein
MERPSHWERHRVLYLSNGVNTSASLLLGELVGYFVNQLPPL